MSWSCALQIAHVLRVREIVTVMMIVMTIYGAVNLPIHFIAIELIALKFRTLTSKSVFMDHVIVIIILADAVLVRLLLLTGPAAVSMKVSGHAEVTLIIVQMMIVTVASHLT